MNNDIIKLLNLEGISIDFEKSYIEEKANTLYCHIVLLKEQCCCPICGSASYNIKDYQLKKITHSISTAKPCIIMYKARRYTCKDCGNIFYEKNPFTREDQKVSTFTKLLVLDDLKSHTATYTSVAKHYNLTTQTVINIFDEFVQCSRLPLPEVICIDEIYTNRLNKSSKYACVFLDFKTRELVEVYSSRHKNYLTSCLASIDKVERDNVQAVIIDMWDTYRDLSHIFFRKAIVAVDSFHIIEHLNRAITKVRIRVMNRYKKQSVNKFIDHDMYYYMLKKFHYFFTKDYNDIYDGEIKVYKIHSKWKKDEILKYLLSIDKDLEYAYKLKEKYREFNLTAEYNTCDEELNELIESFYYSHLEEYQEFGKMINRWKKEIKNSFIRVPIRFNNNGEPVIKRLSNGPMEGTNSRLKCLIKNANGFTNFNRFRNRCFFVINKNTPIKGVPNKK